MNESNLTNFNISVKDIGQLGFGLHSLLKIESDHPDARFDVLKSEGSAMSNNVYGINHRQSPLAIPQNRDHYGLTFFTRPQLNFRAENLRQSRLMTKLLTQTELSVYRFIRNSLDPRLDSAFGEGLIDKEDKVSCALVDPYQAFLPVLTNSITNISGWPDMRIDTYTSKAGPYKEEWSIVDGVAENYSAYDLTASFRSLKGDIILQKFFYWELYQSKVFEGVMSPYFDFIKLNEIDYNTRIYRLVLDPTKRYVTHMAMTGASYPYAGPFSAIYDFSAGKPYNDSLNEIQIPFKCMGAVYDDDIIIRAFNDVVGIFHPGMRVKSVFDKPGATMVKVPMPYLSAFNHRGYPRIDPHTRELQWYVDASYYEEKLRLYEQLDAQLDYALGYIDSRQLRFEGGE